jgi:surface polysaccharide O-acyltransferase-like enzyme
VIFSYLSGEKLMTMVLLIIVLCIPSLRRTYVIAEKFKETSVIEKRIFFFDFIKGIAMLAVILIHTLLLFKLFHKGNEQLIFIANNLLRFAVPVFLICTGVLLNPKSVANRNGIVMFYLKKIVSIFLPYIFATSVVALYFHADVKSFFYLLFTGKAQAPYYYIVVLMQLYLIYPILVRISKQRLLVGSFVISLVSYFLKSSWNLYDIPLFFPYLYFFSYGIAQREFFLKKNNQRGIDRNYLIVIFAYIICVIVKPEYYFNMVYMFAIAVWGILSGFTITQIIYAKMTIR